MDVFRLSSFSIHFRLGFFSMIICHVQRSDRGNTHKFSLDVPTKTEVLDLRRRRRISGLQLVMPSELLLRLV